MGYFSVTASGTGVSGNTLPHTEMIIFTTRFAETGKYAQTYGQSLNAADTMTFASMTENIVYEEVLWSES